MSRSPELPSQNQTNTEGQHVLDSNLAAQTSFAEGALGFTPDTEGFEGSIPGVTQPQAPNEETPPVPDVSRAPEIIPRPNHEPGSGLPLPEPLERPHQVLRGSSQSEGLSWPKRALVAGVAAASLLAGDKAENPDLPNLPAIEAPDVSLGDTQEKSVVEINSQKNKIPGDFEITQSSDNEAPRSGLKMTEEQKQRFEQMVQAGEQIKDNIRAQYPDLSERRVQELANAQLGAQMQAAQIAAEQK